MRECAYKHLTERVPALAKIKFNIATIRAKIKFIFAPLKVRPLYSSKPNLLSLDLMRERERQTDSQRERENPSAYNLGYRRLLTQTHLAIFIMQFLQILQLNVARMGR